MQLSESVRLRHKQTLSDNKVRKTTNNITRNASSSGINIFNIIDILTLLSPAAKLAVLLRIPLLIKVEVSNFSLLHIPKWLCLVHHRQFAISLQRVKRSVIYKFPCFSVRYSTMVSFILSNTFSVTEIPPKRNSAKCQLLRLYSQFSLKC